MDEGGPAAIEDAEGFIGTRTDERFVEVLRVELPRVQRIAALLVGDRTAAEDLVAEAVANVLPKWRAGRVDDCGAYLRRAVTNLARQRWRRLRLSRSRDYAAATWATAAATTSDAAEGSPTLIAVRQLPPRRRAVVVLRFYDDLSEVAIAEVLGISVGTVKSQLARALEQLRRALGDLN